VRPKNLLGSVSVLAIGALATGLVALPGCALIEPYLPPSVAKMLAPPKVTFLGADLVTAPSQLDLSAYYCPRVLKDRGGLGATADFLCAQLFGRPPAQKTMEVGFDLRFEVANPNEIPLPLSEILSAITVFPGKSNQSLGAVCLGLCAPDDPNCLGGARNDGCQQAPGDLKSASDFPRALANLLVARGIGAAGGKPAGFEVPKVIASSSVQMTARLALLPEALLPVMEQLAAQSLDRLKKGSRVAFEIPYAVEGTIFANAGSLGRVAAGYGPASGVWPIPTERLLP